MLSLDFQTMGCQARALLDADGAAARAALGGLPAWFARRERVLSRFDPNSALARLNAAGFARPVDPLLWEALGVALAAASASDGLVTPTILPALERAGYRSSFERLAEDVLGPTSGSAPPPDRRRVQRDAGARSVVLPPGVRLDLGGTAKGWSADLAVAWLAAFGPALVEVGGDVAASPREGATWPVAVGDPRGGGEPPELLLLGAGGVATSGRDFRRWSRGGVEQHHLIDPRTGSPSRSDVLTATVIAPSALEAEVAAKRLLLAGTDEGLSWIEAQPALAAMVVRDDGVTRASARFGSLTWRDNQ